MNTDTYRDEPVFFYLVTPDRVRTGDVVHEINGRPVRGGALPIGKVRHIAADKHTGRPEGWQLVPQEPWSRFTRFVDAAAQVKIGRATSVAGRVNPMVAAAAAPLPKRATRRKTADTEQLTLFERPGESS
ncbi:MULTISPECIES: hypothetical protein [unclassified Nocardia]|uniref:hypothetical protein n=1 Tax=unclassified Nocardia TaxID=2637762 RepID=UPI001CE46D12|nr:MULTISPECIES: hypothetical protein [unclassified Nocardia]